MSVSENTVPAVKHVPTPAEFYLARCIEIKIAYWAAVHNLELALCPAGLTDSQVDVLHSFVDVHSSDGPLSEEGCMAQMVGLVAVLAEAKQLA